MKIKTLGLRHVALNVKNVHRAKTFYIDVFGMQAEWEPDAKNSYLTSHGQDNLALHETDGLKTGTDAVGALDHFGFAFITPEDVDALHSHALELGVTIVQAPKRHRDGAYSCYVKDPDGNVVQAICHPPIVKAAKL